MSLSSACARWTLLLVIVIAVVSGALVLGATWGLYGPLPTRVKGFLVALAGGSLMLSSVTELVQPSIERSSLLVSLVFTLVGAVVFTVVDYWIDERWGEQSGGGLLAAITLDGIPENLALGVALIGSDAKEVAALAASILLSNVPEAAGGAQEMRKGNSNQQVLLLWSGAALALSVAALVGNFALRSVSEHVLAAIRCVAAGAVIASLATEVFPKAFREDAHLSGIATALGFALALALSSLSEN